MEVSTLIGQQNVFRFWMKIITTISYCLHVDSIEVSLTNAYANIYIEMTTTLSQQKTETMIHVL